MVGKCTAPVMVTCLRENSFSQRSHRGSLSAAAHSWPVLSICWCCAKNAGFNELIFCKELPNCLAWQHSTATGQGAAPYPGLYYNSIKTLTGELSIHQNNKSPFLFYSLDFCNETSNERIQAHFSNLIHPFPGYNWLNLTTWVVTWLVIWKFETVL